MRLGPLPALRMGAVGAESESADSGSDSDRDPAEAARAHWQAADACLQVCGGLGEMMQERQKHQAALTQASS